MAGIIKALILLMACLGSAAVILKLIDRDLEIRPYVMGWALITAVMFFSGNAWVLVGFVILLKVVYLRNDVEQNISFYLLLFAALPFNYVFPLVPGINVQSSTLPGLLSLVLLVPVMFHILTQEAFRFRRIDVAFLLIMLVFMLGNFRESSLYAFTIPQAIRDNIALILTIGVPYFVISRGIRSRESLYRVMMAFLLGGLTLMFLAYIEVIFTWRPYVDLGLRMGVVQSVLDTFYEWRGGFLRVSATLTGPITFGFFLTMVLAVALAVMKINRSPFILRLLVVGLLLGAVFFTGSRGAWIGIGAYLLVYFVQNLRVNVRRMLMIPMLLVGMVAIFAYQSSGGHKVEGPDLAEADEYGTFEYRADLLRVSLQVIPDHLWFGSRTYRADKRMQTLVQGQGIVDMVNGYVHLAMEWGIVGLGLFLYIVFRGYFYLVRYASEEEEKLAELEWDESDELPPKELLIMRAFGQALAAMLVSLSIQFAFTSYSSTIVLVLWLSLALVRAYRNIGFLEETAAEEAAAPPMEVAVQPAAEG